MHKYILAIDPGNKASAFCLLSPDLRPLVFAKAENELMFYAVCESVGALCRSNQWEPTNAVDIAIEWIQSYGKPVGQEVFETCAWIGRLEERFRSFNVTRILRSQERIAICHSPRANDATIRQALVDRFASGVPNHGKGTKKEPGWFYGFRADVWSAYAIGVTYYDLKKAGEI